MNNWKEVNQTLEKTFEFATFEDAMHFMQAASPFISAMNHHPTWINTYNRIQVKLTTHDAGNTITHYDRELAKVLDEVYAAM